MAYIKSKNSDCVIVNEVGVLVEGSAEELANHPSMTTTDAYEIIDAEAPIIIKSKIIFSPPEVS